MPRARQKATCFDVIRGMRSEAKKGKKANSDPIHSPDSHKLFCLWMPATNKFVKWDINGNHQYTEAFDKIFRDNPQDLRLQSGYKLLQHKGAWRIYFFFTCKQDVKIFVANSDLTFFRLTEKIPTINGRWLPEDLDNIFRLESYPYFLNRKAIPDDDDVVDLLNKEMIPKAFPNRIFPLRIIRIRRQRFSLEMEFNSDLSASDFESLKKVEIKGYKFSVHGLFGNRFYSCPFCNRCSHKPSECSLAKRKYVTFHYDYLLSKKDLRVVLKQTGAVDILLGTPVSEHPRPWMDHCTVIFNSEDKLLKNESKLKSYAFKAKPANVDLWIRPQFVNCCTTCGLHRSSDFCNCNTVKSAGPIISGEAHLSGSRPDSGPSEWNPWASSDHAEFQAFQKESLKNPPADAPFEDVKEESLESDMAAPSSKDGASKSPAKPKSKPPAPKSKPPAPRKQISNEKPFFECLKDKGLKVFDIPEQILKPVKVALQRSKVGWHVTGKSQYAEKIVGNKSLFGDKMAISYDKNKKLRYAEDWNVHFEALAREASLIASSDSLKVQVNMFIANRYDCDEQTGGVHADHEPQCDPKLSLVIPIGPRHFHFMNSKDPTSPGYKSTTLTLDTGQMVLIPPELNTGPHQVFHSKGKGLAGGQHFTLVGKTYVGSKKAH